MSRFLLVQNLSSRHCAQFIPRRGNPIGDGHRRGSLDRFFSFSGEGHRVAKDQEDECTTSLLFRSCHLGHLMKQPNVQHDNAFNVLGGTRNTEYP